jgi:thioredoxin-like negative regulator of GroEL
VLARLAKEYEGKVDFTDYNIYEHTEKASTFRISATPTLVFLDRNGNEVSRLVGYQAEERIRAHIEPLLAE